MAEMTERVETLEQLMSDLLRAQQRTETSLDAYIRESREGRRVLQEEMREFKEESRADRKTMHEEMRAYREEGRLQRERMDRESREFKEESQADRRVLHEEMVDFKERMLAYREEERLARRELDRKWGDLANKMGTVVEDIILPGFPGAVRRTFGVELDTLAVRVRRKHPHDRGREREFDIVATDASRFFLNETKSNPRMQYAREFLESLDEVLEYFPEYADRTLVPIFSSLSLPGEVVDYLSTHGCYAMMMGEEHMEIVNASGAR